MNENIDVTVVKNDVFKNFVEFLKTIKLYKADGGLLDLVVTPKIFEIFETIDIEENNYIFIEKEHQVCMSEFFVVYSLYQCLTYDNYDVAVLHTTKTQAESFIYKLQDIITKNNLDNNLIFKSNEILFSNKSKITTEHQISEAYNIIILNECVDLRLFKEVLKNFNYLKLVMSYNFDFKTFLNDVVRKSLKVSSKKIQKIINNNCELTAIKNCNKLKIERFAI